MKNVLRNTALLALTVLFNSGLFAQNDSILPNQYAEYYVVHTIIGIQDTIFFEGQTPLNDTVNVKNSEGDTLAFIWLDGMKAYIKKGADDLGSLLGYPVNIPDTFSLLYDFTLQVGDTTYNGLTVVERDTIQIQGESKVVLQLWDGIWIQGIGDPRHPFFTYIDDMYASSVSICSGYFEYSGSSPIDTLTYACDNFYDIDFDHYCDCFINTEEYVKNTLKMYPNPANEKINIFYNGKASGTLIIRDMNGKVVKTVPVGSDAATYIIPVSHLSSGVYAVVIESGGKVVVKEKLVKE